MSAPMKRNISHELISASSALNTHVTYAGPHRTANDDFVWMPDVEPMIAHSQEHIHAAIDMLSELRRDLSSIQSEVYKIADESTYNRIDKMLRAIDQKL
mgnify:CR=1 FL=1|jgi:hypothetical protein